MAGTRNYDFLVRAPYFVEGVSGLFLQKRRTRDYDCSGKALETEREETRGVRKIDLSPLDPLVECRRQC